MTPFKHFHVLLAPYCYSCYIYMRHDTNKQQRGAGNEKSYFWDIEIVC